MKYSLTLVLAAFLGLGALPSTANARTVVVVSENHPIRHRIHHRNSHRVFHAAHWERRHGHRVYIPARTVTVFY